MYKTYFKLKIVIMAAVAVLFWKGYLQNFSFPEPSSGGYNEAKLTIANTAGKVIHWKPYLGWIIDRHICVQVKDSTFVLAHLNRPPHTPIYVYPDETDQYISRDILKMGSYEDYNVETIIKYMEKFPDAVFLDLGANIGSFSIPIAALGYRVIAVECLRSSVMRLCASMEAAKVTDKMTIVYNVMNDKHEKVSLKTETGNIGMTYVVNMTSGSEPIDTILLDDLLEVFNLQQVIMKMDVHQYEDIVLNGGQMFFKKVKVEAVLMEFVHHQDDRYDNDGKFIVNFMSLHGMEADVPEHMKLDYKNWITTEILFKRK